MLVYDNNRRQPEAVIIILPSNLPEEMRQARIMRIHAHRTNLCHQVRIGNCSAPARDPVHDGASFVLASFPGVRIKAMLKGFALH